MNQQNAAGQQTIREEERVLGIAYERALAMVPRLIRGVSEGEPEVLGDGYFVARIKTPQGARELTVRLGRQGADTRFSVRVESLSQLNKSNAKMFAIILAVTIVTLGLGILAFLPYLVRMSRAEVRERDLLVHKTFRAIEDAVAEQGAAANYRIAPGADAAAPAGVEGETNEEAASAEPLEARAR